MNPDPKTTTVSVLLPVEQRSWLIHQAADRAAETGARVSVSQVVRELVDAAREGLRAKHGEAA